MGKNSSQQLGSKSKIIKQERKRYPISCHSKPGKLCCKQMRHTNKCSSTATKRTCNIYSKFNWKSSYLFYLMEWILCKRPYTDKSETAFNIRLNNHHNDPYKPKSQKQNNLLDYLVIICQKLLLLYIIVNFRPILWPWSHSSYKWVSTNLWCYFVKICYIKN